MASVALDDGFAVANLYSDALPSGAHLTWLQTARAEGKARFDAVGLPTIKDEEWRYTNLRALKSTPFSNNAAAAPSVKLNAVEHPRAVFIDGVFAPEHSNVSSLVESKVRVLSMREALEAEPALLEAHLTKAAPAAAEQHGFTALNSAYFNDGYVVIVAKGAVLEQPIEMLFVAGEQQVATMSHSRNLVVAHENSQCTIVERYQAQQGLVYLHNVVTEVVAERGAHVDHYKIQQESDDGFHVGAVYVNQARDSHVTTHNVTLTGLVTRNDIISNLQGEGAHVEMNGLVIGHGRQHIDSFTQVNHLVPHTTSDEYYKTILDDHSRAVFRGRILVAQDAQKTNADQQNNNLLLSDTAEADSKPQLEIYADDVKCSHGATVGQLDPKSIFYLNSRGLDDGSARALLTFAFANQVIERVKVPEVRDELTQLIAGELLHGLQDVI